MVDFMGEDPRAQIKKKAEELADVAVEKVKRTRKPKPKTDTYMNISRTLLWILPGTSPLYPGKTAELTEEQAAGHARHLRKVS